MSWTDERIERLKKMWAKGATASQIADELGGVSRNAVIGKAHRLGLEQRPSPVKPGEEKEAKKPAAAAPAAAAPKSAPKAEAPKPAAAAAATTASAAPQSANPPPLRAGNAVPLDRPRRLYPPGSRRSAATDPAGPAAPLGAGQAEPGSCRQDEPARAQRPRLQMADWPPRRARLPFLRRTGEPRLPLLRRPIAASPIRRSSRAATAVPRRRSPLAVPASVKLEPPSAAKPARSAA